MSSPNTYPCSSSALPSSPQPTSVVASSSSTEVPASSALAPVRGNKRIYAGFVAAPSLEEVADSVVSDSGDESETTSQELARLRSEIHSSQAAQATAEASFTKEIMRRESLQMACSSARREMKQTQTEVHRLRERQSSVLQELDAFNVQVDVHKELYQRLENCIKSAEDEFQRLTQYTSPQKKVFTATVATNTSQIRRLHHLLSDSDIADDSANTRLERRNEDIRDQVKRFSTCELNWELLDVSGQTRDILKRLYVMKDSTMSGENFAAGLAWIACREGDDLELSQDDRAANARKNSPGTSYVEVQKSNSNTRPRLLLAQSSGAASKAHITREPPVASISPCEAVSEVPASLSVDVSELQQPLVPPNDQGFDHALADDAESDAEFTSTLVFASGDKSENNTPTGPADQSTVVENVEADEAPVATDAGSSCDALSVQGNSAVLASTSSVPTTTTPRPMSAPRRSSRGSIREVATVSPTPGSDKQLLRPLVSLPSPVHGP
ncbi:hypothetical protein PC113_g19600 [Phytophthora cactorum]|uniref:Uncharacterized protein n=1 Tax=Phytophthora cactorum TaxID=29920 RepID=A0A8T0YED9_9STRA|nr:hypothetical protein PC113_g19600 [Phytophthora cactorum]